MTTLLFLVLDEKTTPSIGLVTGTQVHHVCYLYAFVFLLLGCQMIDGVVFSSSTKNNNVVMELSIQKTST